LQAAIWQRDFLRRVAVSGESAWDFEEKGTQRIIEIRRAGNDVSICAHIRPALEYVNAVGGRGLRRGELDMKKIPPRMIEELKHQNLL
jgi:hypothetical protein